MTPETEGSQPVPCSFASRRRIPDLVPYANQILKATAEFVVDEVECVFALQLVELLPLHLCIAPSVAQADGSFPARVAAICGDCLELPYVFAPSCRDFCNSRGAMGFPL